MMIKCQKCGFENQMGSIFCRSCGEKLDMDAIDPNKLQKDVNKEKNIKRAKKRVREAIETGVGILVVAAFIFAVVYKGWDTNKYYSVKEEPNAEEAAAAQKKFDAVLRGTTVGDVKYTYPEINSMFRDQIVKKLYDIDSFAKIVSFEMGFNEKENQPEATIWIEIKEKVPVRYIVRGDFFLNVPGPEAKADDDTPPLDVDVKRLDIGLLPYLNFIGKKAFLGGFRKSLLEDESMRNFFSRAQSVEFTPEGMNVKFVKGGQKNSSASDGEPAAPKASASAGVAALKGGSTAALSEKDEAAREAARQKAEEKKQKAAEEAEKKKALEEERKRKAEEYKQQQKEREEERKRKAEEERERKKQEKEERERQVREENERRRQERENRRNNNYNNNNRNSRSSRNRGW